MRQLCVVLAVLAVSACDSAEVGPPAPPLGPATFRVTLDATWSAATHPEAFPPNPHFSRLTGAAHAADVALWRVGGAASEGVRVMAETGGTGPLRDAVAALGDRAAFVEGPPLRLSPGTAAVEVPVTAGRPLVTVVAMLAPSPDWFVGVSGLDLRDGDGWAERVAVDAVVYDAETDDGAAYTSADAPRAERVPIGPVAYAPLAGVAVGTLTFERVGAR